MNWEVNGGINNYKNLKGTSMASPVAAAAAALIWSAHPNISGSEVLKKLYDGADKIDDKNKTKAGLLGAGRVNIFNSIR